MSENGAFFTAYKQLSANPFIAVSDWLEHVFIHLHLPFIICISYHSWPWMLWMSNNMDELLVRLGEAV